MQHTTFQASHEDEEEMKRVIDKIVNTPEYPKGNIERINETPEPKYEPMTARELFLRIIDDDPTLKYLYDPKTPEKTISNCWQWSACHNCDLTNDEIEDRAHQLYEKMDFNLVYGAYKNWDHQFDYVCHQMRIRWDRDRRNKHKLLAIVFHYHLRQSLSSDEMYLKIKQTRIQIDELSFVLRSITAKIFSEWDKKRIGHAVIAHNYFLCKRTAHQYKQKTGRALGKHKLIFMINLLDRHGFIKKIRRKIGANRYAKMVYEMGTNNPYYLQYPGRDSGITEGAENNEELINNLSKGEPAHASHT